GGTRCFAGRLFTQTVKTHAAARGRRGIVGCAQASLAYSCRLAASLRPTRTGRSHLRVGGYNEKCPALCACVFSFKGLAQASLACPCRLAASLSPHTQAAAICGWEATTKNARHCVPVFFHLKDSLKQAWRAL